MPAGNPKPQTIASEKWARKVGYKAASFKLKADLVQEFKQACSRNGVSQASVLSAFMKEYIAQSTQKVPDEPSLENKES